MGEPRAGGGEDDVDKLLAEVDEAGRSPLNVGPKELHDDMKHTEYEALLAELTGFCPEQEEEEVALSEAQGLGEFDIDALEAEMVEFSAAIGVRVDTETIAEPATAMPMTETTSDDADTAALFDLRCSIEGDSPAMDGGKTGSQLCRELDCNIEMTEEDTKPVAPFDLRSSIEADYPATGVVNTGSQLSIELDLGGGVTDDAAANVALRSYKLPTLPPAEKVADSDSNALETKVLEIEVDKLLASTRFSTKNYTAISPATATPAPEINDDVGGSSLSIVSTTETEFSACKATEEAMVGPQVCAQFDLDEGIKQYFPTKMTPRLSKLLAVLRAKRRRLLRGGFRSLLSFRVKAVVFEFQTRLRAQAQNISDLEEQLVAERTGTQRVGRSARAESQRDACAEIERMERATREEAKRMQLAARIEKEEVEEAARAKVRRTECASQADIERVTRAFRAEAKRAQLAFRAEVWKVEQAAQVKAERVDQAAQEKIQQMEQAACAEIERMERASRAEARRVQLAAREEIKAARIENEKVKEAARAEVQRMERAAQVGVTFQNDVPFSVFRHILLRPGLNQELLAVVSERKARQEHLLVINEKKVLRPQLPDIDNVPGAGAAFFVSGYGGAVVCTCAESVFWDPRIVYTDVPRGLPALGCMTPSTGVGRMASRTVEEVGILKARGWPSTSAASVCSGRYSSTIARLDEEEGELHEGGAAGTGAVARAPHNYEEADGSGIGGQEGTGIVGGIDATTATDLFGRPLHEWRLILAARPLLARGYDVPPIPAGIVYAWSGHTWPYSQVRTPLQAVSSAGRAPSPIERTAVVPFVAAASTIGGALDLTTSLASAVIENPPRSSDTPFPAPKTPSKRATARQKRPAKKGRDKGRRAVLVAQNDTAGIAKRANRSTTEQRPSDPTLTEKRVNSNGDLAAMPAVSDTETEPPQVEAYGTNDAGRTRASPTALYRLRERERRISGVFAVLQPLSNPAVHEITAHIASYYARILEADGGAAAEKSQDGTASSEKGTFANPAVADATLGGSWKRAHNFREIERILHKLDDEDYCQFEKWLVYARRALNSETSKDEGGSKELHDDPPNREQFDFSLAETGEDAKTPFFSGSGASVMSSSQTVRFGEAKFGTARAPEKPAPPVERSAERKSTSTGRPWLIAASMLAAALEAEGGPARSLIYVDQPTSSAVEHMLRQT